ncbi:MAG TPA: hypothetical protein VH062_27730 [Polyangiaceae bacterium]|jgi:hypothetical protein|nr:hypothetical protein [Polyangiaceae bacterium]
MALTAISTSDALGAVSRAIEAGLAVPGAMSVERFTAFLALQRELGLVQGERPLCHHLSPFVISNAEYAQVAVAAEHVVSALGRVAERALHDSALADALGLSPEERELAAIDPGYPELLTVGRLDALMHENGFAFIELNADSPGGIVDQMLVERTLFELPHLTSLRDRDDLRTPRPHDGVLDALLRAYRASGRGGNPTIALVDFETTGTLAEIKVLAELFCREGYPSFFADPKELRYDGRRLSARGREIDLVYRRVLVNELLAEHGMEHPLLLAYRDGAVCVANSFRTKAVNKKAAFAVLCDPAYGELFTEDERRAIADHVPWTRQLSPGAVDFHGESVELRELVTREQQRFVLKPNDEYGGVGVVLGWEATEEQWRRALLAAEDELVVVQERLRPRTTRMPVFDGDAIGWEDVYFDLCPFVFGGRMEGGIVRLSSTGITNVSAGANVSTLLIVGDAGDDRSVFSRISRHHEEGGAHV